MFPGLPSTPHLTIASGFRTFAIVVRGAWYAELELHMSLMTTTQQFYNPTIDRSGVTIGYLANRLHT
jgi:hypothetical protein